jgi:hypothetical protein
LFVSAANMLLTVLWWLPVLGSLLLPIHQQFLLKKVIDYELGKSDFNSYTSLTGILASRLPTS